MIGLTLLKIVLNKRIVGSCAIVTTRVSQFGKEGLNYHVLLNIPVFEIYTSMNCIWETCIFKVMHVGHAYQLSLSPFSGNTYQIHIQFEFWIKILIVIV